MADRSEIDAKSAGRNRRSDFLADDLASRIAANEIREGERLPSERELMEQYGVSRTGVREAIAALANRGLIVTRPGYRPVVGRPDVERTIRMIGDIVGHLLTDEAGVRNLFETRIFLECALARAAAEQAARQDLADLRAALDRNEAAIGHRAECYASDMAFHAVLYRVPRNPIYPVIHRAYTEWLYRHWLAQPASPEIDRVNFASHAALFEAIAARDGDAAATAMRRHLEFAWDLVRSTFSERPTASGA